jgi:pimeloyl-ACP methyl ester carboxylesterase
MLQAMKVLSLEPAHGAAFPQSVLRLEYQSAVDNLQDWALLLPGKKTAQWIVVLHGHGSCGDQLYTRPDIRESWLPKFLAGGAGILTVNLRGNAWMSPAAAADLHDLLEWMRSEQGLERTLFYSGSMGGTSNLIYAALHPEDVNVLVALGAATDIASYYSWCLEHQENKDILLQIARAIEESYGGNPVTRKVLFTRHSALQNVAQLTMPIYLAHGAADATIPVEQARQFAQVMARQKYFYYQEIPDGNHDSPLWDEGAWDFVKRHFLAIG